MEVVTIASKVPTNLNIGGIVVWGNTRVPPGTARQQPEMGGYVLTPDFPKDVWDKWLEANKSSHMVVNKMIYADVDGNLRASLLPRTLGIPVQFGEVPYKG